MFVAGGGSVLTRIPLNGTGVSDGVRAGMSVVCAELHAANAMVTMMSNIRRVQIRFIV